MVRGAGAVVSILAVGLAHGVQAAQAAARRHGERKKVKGPGGGDPIGEGGAVGISFRRGFSRLRGRQRDTGRFGRRTDANLTHALRLHAARGAVAL